MKWVTSDAEFDTEYTPDEKSHFEKFDGIPPPKGYLSNNPCTIDGKPKFCVTHNGNVYVDWVTYPKGPVATNDPFERDLPKELENKRKARRKYEIFCGGFLYFYDTELENYADKFEKYAIQKGINVTECVKHLKDYFNNKLNLAGMDHKVIFEWGKNPDNNDRFSVRIYINPPAGNPDPPETPPPPPPESFGP